MGDLGRPTLCTAPALSVTPFVGVRPVPAYWVGRTPELVTSPGLMLFNTLTPVVVSTEVPPDMVKKGAVVPVTAIAALLADAWL